MSVLSMAGTRRSSGAFASYSALDAFPQFVDQDGSVSVTRTLCARDSDDAIFAVYVRGAHPALDLVDTLNTRSRLTSERSHAVKARDALTEEGAEEASAEVLAQADEAVTVLDTALEALPKIKAEATYHTARTFEHYESVALAEAEAAEAEADADPDAEAPEASEAPTQLVAA